MAPAKKQSRKPKVSKDDRKKASEGALKLTQAARAELAQNATNIAKALREGAIGKNASAARLLIEVAEGPEWMQDPEAVDQALSLAESFSTEKKDGNESPR